MLTDSYLDDMKARGKALGYDYIPLSNSSSDTDAHNWQMVMDTRQRREDRRKKRNLQQFTEKEEKMLWAYEDKMLKNGTAFDWQWYRDMDKPRHVRSRMKHGIITGFLRDHSPVRARGRVRKGADITLQGVSLYRGAKGPGVGYPQGRLPDRLDADNDGVVVERPPKAGREYPAIPQPRNMAESHYLEGVKREGAARRRQRLIANLQPAPKEKRRKSKSSKPLTQERIDHRVR